ALAVGRKRGVVFEHRILQQLALAASIDIGDVEVGRRRGDPVHQHDALGPGASRAGRHALRQGPARFMSQQSRGWKSGQELSSAYHIASLWLDYLSRKIYPERYLSGKIFDMTRP